MAGGKIYLMDISTNYEPKGDQPKAIKNLLDGLKKGQQKQTLLGVTGSGKTFTVANIIQKYNKPTLVIAHNKTLAAQLVQEYRDFFPNDEVHYFVSYYDYYRPEAYIPTSDTYIDKEAQINAEIDRLRHSTTQSLSTKKNVIVVASVSCIYGLGNPTEYLKGVIELKVGDKVVRTDLLKKLINNFYERTTGDLVQGSVRVIGNNLEFVPVNDIDTLRVTIVSGKISKITRIDNITKEIKRTEKEIFVFPGKHFVTDKEKDVEAVSDIKKELKSQLSKLHKEGKILEAERLRYRTQNDLAKIKEVGYCGGIENYSRHFDRRVEGEPPYTLLSFFPKDKNGNPDFLTIIDESHVSVPQIQGMLAGDRARKQTLVDYGFRLPSAKDNRPLSYAEFEKRVGPVIYTTATPAEYEKEVSEQIVEQIIRPTGLLDPEIDIRPVVSKGKYRGQVQDIISEIKKVAKKNQRIMVTTLSKKMAEDLTDYLKDAKIKAEYVHSDVKTIERVEIITSLRKGDFDCLVGVNLLREGLDIPEVSLVAILDADKEGFLRSTTSLIQTIGRAARNSEGRVILYADNRTGSLNEAIEETERRRDIQEKYNKKHNITPTTIKKNIKDITEEMTKHSRLTVDRLSKIEKFDFDKSPKKYLDKKKRLLEEAVKELNFETAALIRDQIKHFEGELKREKRKEDKKEVKKEGVGGDKK